MTFAAILNSTALYLSLTRLGCFSGIFWAFASFFVLNLRLYFLMLCFSELSEMLPLVSIFRKFSGTLVEIDCLFDRFLLCALAFLGFKLLSKLNGGNSCRLELLDLDSGCDYFETFDRDLLDDDLWPVSSLEPNPSSLSAKYVLVAAKRELFRASAVFELSNRSRFGK